VVLVGLIGGLTAVTVAFLWVTMRLFLYGIKSDSMNATGSYVAVCKQAYQTTVAVIALYLIVEYSMISGVVRGIQQLATWIL